MKAHLAARARSLGPAKVLFVRSPDRDHEGIRVLWGRTADDGSWLTSATIERYEALLDLDFVHHAAPVEHPVLLVCTHGKHDPCCARRGRPLFEALRELVEPGWVWQSSHVGGDRFAGNLVVLPDGVYYGRVAPQDAWGLLEDHLAGRLAPSFYRGRSCHPFPVQAGERAVRELTGLWGIGDVRPVSAGPPPRFTAAGREYEVEVVPERGELAQLACGADELRRPRRFAAGIPRERAP